MKSNLIRFKDISFFKIILRYMLIYKSSNLFNLKISGILLNIVLDFFEVFVKNLKLYYIQLAIYLNVSGYQYFYQFVVNK